MEVWLTEDQAIKKGFSLNDCLDIWFTFGSMGEEIILYLFNVEE